MRIGVGQRDFGRVAMNGMGFDLRARLQALVHCVARWLIAFWFRHATLFGLLSLLAFAAITLVMAKVRPVYSWDTLAYVAASARDTLSSAADLHAYAYDTLRNAATPEGFAALVEGDTYRLRQYTDPDAFVSMLGMYEVKWFYIKLLTLLTPLTGAYEAGFVINIFAMILMTGTLALWLRATGMLAYAPLLVCLIFALQFPSFGMMHTPDFLATAFLLAAVLAMDRNWTWSGCALLLLAVLTRPDQFALAGVLMVAAWFWRDRSQIAFLAAFVVCIAGYALTGASGESVGWWPHVWFSTYHMQETMAGFSPDFSLKVYLVAFGYNLFRALFQNTWLAFYGLAIGICIFMYVRGLLAPSRRQVLVFALMVCIPAKYAVFPLHDARIYFGLLLLVFMLTTAELFRQTPRVQDQAARRRS